MAAGHSSTGISPRPMLMGAPRNALRAFNAGVSLSCLRILAHRLPHLFYGSVLSLTCLVGVPSCGLATGLWRTGRPAPHRQIVSVCLMLRRRPPAGLSLSRSDTGHHMERGKHAAPGPESAQVKIQDGDNQLRFQPPAHIFIHQGVRKAVFVIACPHGQRSNIARIVLDHPVHRFGIASDSGGDYRIRDQ